MKKILKFLDKHTEEIMLVCFMVGIVVVMLYQIVRRYVFNNSLTWSEEFCRYCFIWFMFIGYSYSIHQNIDLRMDAVVTVLPHKLQKLMSLVVLLIGLALTVLLFVSSFGAVEGVIETGETSTSLHLPMWVVYISMVVGFGLAIFRYCQRIVREFVIRKDKGEKTE